MTEMNFAQQRHNFDPALAGHVTVVGAGNVGGWVVHDLAKLGVTRFTVYDFDHVESHNVPPSVYRTDDIGKYKVLMLQEFVRERTGVCIDARVERYEEQRFAPGPVVVCVDKMSARKAVWKKVFKDPRIPVLVDTRIDDDFVHVVSVDPCDPKDHERYGMLLYDDSEVQQPTCGRHGVRHVTALASAFALACLKSAWKGEARSRECKMIAGSLRFVGGRIDDIWYDGGLAACVVDDDED